MRFTGINDDTMPTGLLRVWRPTAETMERAATAPVDPRRTSHNQEGHLARAIARRIGPELIGEIEDPTGAADKPAPTGWLAIRFDVPPSNPHVLRRCFERWIDRHETLRSGFRATGGTHDEIEIERFTIPADTVRLESSDHGQFDDPAALAEYLDDLFNASTDAVCWPAYVFCAVTSANSTTLFLAFDHLNVDGYSILLMANEVRELIDADREDRPAQLPMVPSYLDFVEAERVVASHAIESHDAVEQWARFLGDEVDVPAFPLPDGLVPGSQIPQGSACLRILSEAEAAAFGRWCRRRGTSAGSGFLGAYTLACLRRAATAAPGGPLAEQFRVLVSTHTRNEPHWGLALGWFTAVAPYEVTIPAGQSFSDAVPALDEAWSRAKRGAALPLDRIGELLGHPVAPRFVVSYLDARHAISSDRWDWWNAHAYFGDVGPTDEVYTWINRVPTETYLTWRYPDNDVCRTEIRAVTDLMREIILSVITPHADELTFGQAAGAAPPEETTTW